MRASYAGCAILAQTLIPTAAFALPEPTQRFAVAVDYWSPAPTAAPQLGFNLFGRGVQQKSQGNTCGYISGLSESPVTCPDPTEICATNNYYGVHGCCDSSNISSCTIATSCIASTAMSTLCTDGLCSSNDAIAKCTESTAMECYTWLFAYERTTMTQRGCTASGFISTAQHSYGPLSTSLPSVIVVTVTALELPATTPTEDSHGASEKKQSLGPIVGGTVGGCAVISLVALAAFLVHRRRAKQKFSPSLPPSQYQHNSPGFNPAGFETRWNEQDIKTLQQSGGIHRPGVSYIGVSEIHEECRAMEVEAPENNKFGMRETRETGPVEVDATTVRDERKLLRAPVEAPTEVDR